MIYLLNSKISDHHRLLLNVTVKINLKRNDRYVPLSNLSIRYTWKIEKSHIWTINLKSQLQYGVESLNYPMDQILCQIFKIILSIHLQKKHGEKDVNSPIGICLNKMENRIAFKIKTRFYYVFLTSETKKLLGSTKSKITKNKNCENVSNLENTELILVHCNVVNNNYWKKSEVLYTFVPK